MSAKKQKISHIIKSIVIELKRTARSLFMLKMRLHISHKKVMLIAPTIEWNMPMFQRPQQLACAYAKKKDMVVIYFTPNFMYDRIKIAEETRTNLFVFNPFYMNDLVKILSVAKETILTLAWPSNIDYVKRLLPQKVIYEYIDDLHIFHDYGPELVKMHESLLKNSDLTVCTATALYDQVKNIAKKAIISTNGGDYDFFSQRSSVELHPNILATVSQYDCVLGYYGALASWFDYDLVKQVAAQHPNWLWLLIGMDYDDSLGKAGLSEVSNILYVGVRPYKELPAYLGVFDIATIPFKLNEITQATSPVKLFEYMAAGKPILTPRMPECMKYDSVKTYRDASEFCAIVEQYRTIEKDDIYWKTLDKEALENTWDARTDEILKALQ